MNIPPNQHAAASLPMNHMAPINSQMIHGQQRIVQQGQQLTQQQQIQQQAQHQHQQQAQQQAQHQHQQQSQQQLQQPQQQLQQAQQQPQQQLQQAQQQPQQQQKTDEDFHTVVPKLYAKVKSLVGPLRETLISLVQTAAQTLQQNSLLDSGTLKSTDHFFTKFNKTIEEFYSTCDQIEYHLATLIEIQRQSSSSERYMPLPVITPRTEKSIGQKPALTYSQFLITVKNQVSYAKEVHDALVSVAYSLTLGDH